MTEYTPILDELNYIRLKAAKSIDELSIVL